MVEPDRIDEQDNEPTAEEVAAWKKKLELSREVLAWVLFKGLEWSESEKNVLVHPNDPDLNVWRNPYTEELLLSPRLVELFKQDFGGEREIRPTG